MADTKPTPPTPASKSISIESIRPGERANTGGDPYDRYRGNYSKTPPVRDNPLADY